MQSIRDIFAVVAVCLLTAPAAEPPCGPPPSPAETGIRIQSRKPAKRSHAEALRPPAGTLGHLETRDRRVTITAGSKEPLYTVRDKQGRLLHENLTARQLQAKAPAVHRLVTGAYAGGASRSSVTLDAAVRLSTPVVPSGR